MELLTPTTMLPALNEIVGPTFALSIMQLLENEDEEPVRLEVDYLLTHQTQHVPSLGGNGQRETNVCACILQEILCRFIAFIY